MNELEIRRIAAGINQLRPDWPVASIVTLLNKPTITNRPRRDVAVALAWVASDSETRTPGRVLEAGPWWQAAATEGPTRRDPFDATGICDICSNPEERCRQLWTDDHDYESVARARSRRHTDPWDNGVPAAWRPKLAEEFAEKKAKAAAEMSARTEKATAKDDA